MTIIYTPLATPLKKYVASSKLSYDATSASLNSDPILGADYYGFTPAIISANYGFEGYMGVPNVNGTDTASQQAAYAGNASWEAIDPALGAGLRAYTSALGANAFFNIYGTTALQADTIPVVFNMPVQGSTVNATDFQVKLNTGELVTPLSASFLPNLEFNEMQTVVLSGYWGNRILPGQPGAQYPVSVTIVQDDTPLTAVTPRGLSSLVGLTIESKNPYVAGNGPILVGAKLNQMSDLGEGGPLWSTASNNNSGTDLFGSDAQYRLRLSTSAGFSPDGIASLAPDEFSQYFVLTALDDLHRSINITESGVQYKVGGFGTVEVLGIADTGPSQASLISFMETF